MNLFDNLPRSLSTPLYLLDSGVLKERVRYLRSRLPKEVKLCYAIKANSFIIKELEPLIDRFEVCSAGEAEICLNAGMPPEKLVLSGVYKDPLYFESLIKKNLPIGIYTAESLQQYQMLRHMAEKHRQTLRLLLRLTGGNQFGMDAETIKKILAEPHPYLDIQGIQYYSGTQKHSLKRQKRELEKIDAFLSDIKQELSFCPQELELGPGFPATYFQGEEFDEEAYLSSFSALLDAMQSRTQITLELGRSIAASCGTYLTTVVDTKCNNGENYAIVDGGIHHLVYFGQVMAMKTPKCSLFPMRSGEEQFWNICGSLCTANDILIKQLPAAGLKVGDRIAFHNAGAYCPTEGMSLFLSHALPAIVLRDCNGQYQILRRPTETHPFNTPKR